MIEVRRISSHIVYNSIKKIDSLDLNDYLIFKDGNGSYNITAINSYKDRLIKTLQKDFISVEKGVYSKDLESSLNYNKNKYNYVKNGYLCEISFNSILNSTLFANVGPTIPVKLSFIGDIDVNIDIKTKEYGINNVVIEVYAIVDIHNQLSMPITTNKYDFRIKEPITLDIVRGEIPNYYLSRQ